MSTQVMLVLNALVPTFPDDTLDQRWSRHRQEREWPGSTATQPWGEHGGEHGDPPPGFDPFAYALEVNPRAFDPQVLYRRSPAQRRLRDTGPGWLVLVDGHQIGEVQSRRVEYPHRVGRAITGYTHANRWVIIAPLAHVSGATWDTRRQAAARLIEKAINVNAATALSWVSPSRVETVADRTDGPLPQTLAETQLDTARAFPAYAAWRARWMDIPASETSS